jgi:aminoglycoside phosphotransferase
MKSLENRQESQDESGKVDEQAFEAQTQIKVELKTNQIPEEDDLWCDGDICSFND